MMSHLSILPEMNLHLHPITIRTIQQTCRYNMKVRKNWSLMFQPHPALEVQREPSDMLTRKMENQKTLRGPDLTMITKLISFLMKHIRHS